jgi:hypothetical protein
MNRATVMNDRRLLRTLLFLGLATACVGACVGVAYSASRPAIRITAGPPDRTDENEAQFKFKVPKGVTTTCARDGLSYKRCIRSVKYSGLKAGRHTFKLKAKKGKRVMKIMKRKWTILRRVGSTTSSQPSPQGSAGATDPLPPGPPQLVFDDEFNGPAGSGPDPAIWNIYDSPGNSGIGLRRPSAFAMDGEGNLVVTANMQGGQIVSGGMAHRTEYTYGRFEFRVRTEADPTGTISGVILTWPDQQWSPEFTENDIYETGAFRNNDYRFDSFIHFGTQNWQKWFTHDADPTKWHTMVMDWTPDRLDILRDGALVWSLTDKPAIPDILHHICIQLDPRSHTTLTKPVRMFVDYVRIYR